MSHQGINHSTIDGWTVAPFLIDPHDDDYWCERVGGLGCR